MEKCGGENQLLRGSCSTWLSLTWSMQQVLSVQFSSVAQSCLTLCDPMNHSTPGLPLHHQLPEFTHSHPSSQWCHPAISSSGVPFSSCPQSLPASVFSNESTLRMRWPKYWSFSFSIIPSKEIPGLIYFRMDWLDLLAVHTRLPTPKSWTAWPPALWAITIVVFL